MVAENINDEPKDVVDDQQTNDVDVNTDNTDVGTEPKEKVSEPKEGIISRIGRILKGEKPDSEPEDTDHFEIPTAFYKAATEAGWSDEDIENWLLDEDGKTKYSNKELTEMIDFISPPKEASDKSDTPSVPESKEKEEENKVDDSEKDKTISSLQQRIAALEKVQETDTETRKQQTIKERVLRASKIFDDVNKDSGMFGETEKLPKFPDGRVIPTSPEMRARVEVWGTASSLMQLGWPVEKAMDVSLDAYKGKHLENTVKRDLIKDLKKHEKKISPKRSSHIPAEKVPKYGPDVVQNLQKKVGVVD